MRGIVYRIGCAAGLLLALPWLGVATPSATAQGDALPCGLQAQRQVQPTVVAAGEPVTVTTRLTGDCEAQGARGVDVMFVVDRSITVHEDQLLGEIKDGLTNFVLGMDFERGSAGLITYARRQRVASNLSHDQQRILNAIRSIRLSEENDVRGVDGAFRTAVGKLDNDGDPSNQKVVIVTVAGPDQSQSLVNMPTVTQSARNAGVQVVFLLFPLARYVHLVEAASECPRGCPPIGGPGGRLYRRWAFFVGKDSYVDQMNELAERLVRPRTIDEIELEEMLHTDAQLVAGSASPAPSEHVGARLLWRFSGLPPGGITITYRAAMMRPDATYPVAQEVTLRLVDDQDDEYTLSDLGNPPVDVGAAPPTATATPVPNTPTPAPATPTATSTPQATATTRPHWLLHLPALLRNHDG